MEVCDVDVGVGVDELSMKYGEGHRVLVGMTQQTT
jgi:putative component of toxin-antitoxin plasmid stabilization module